MYAFAILVGLIPVSRLIHNKKVSSFILFAYIWLLFAFSYGNADYYNYEYQFQIYRNPGLFEIKNAGFKILCKVANDAGLNYQTFLIIQATIILLISFIIIIKFSDNPWEVTLLYIIYSFPIDTVQVRMSLGRTVVLLGLLIYLLARHRAVKFVGLTVCTIAGAMIHVSLFAYLVFLLIPFLDRKYIKVWIAGILIFEFVVMRNFQTIALLVTSSSNVNEYLTKSVSVFYVIFVITYMVVNYLISLGCYRLSRCQEYVNPERSEFIDFVFRINTLLLIFAPMACVASDFLRLFRISIFLNYIAISNIHQNANRFRERSTVIPVNSVSLCRFGIVAMALISNYMFISSSYMDTVVRPLFENNLLIH